MGEYVWFREKKKENFKVRRSIKSSHFLVVVFMRLFSILVTFGGVTSPFPFFVVFFMINTKSVERGGFLHNGITRKEKLQPRTNHQPFDRLLGG